APQTDKIAVPADATFDAGPKFPEDWNANADAMSKLAVGDRASADAAPIILEVLSDARIQQVTANHRSIPASIRRRTASRLYSRPRSRYRANSARSASVNSSGSMPSTHDSQAASASASSLHSSPVTPILF